MANLLKVSVLCVTLSVLTMLTGCSKKGDNWLIGNWAYDSEMTKKNLPADTKAQGVPDNMAQQMGTQLITQLMDQMKNCKFQITAEKITATLGDGVENSSPYKIIERPDANTMIVEDKDGEKTTFTKSGKYICMSSTGAVQFNIYFKPEN